MEFSEVHGTCQTMCPEAEVTMREMKGLLHPLEMSHCTSRISRGRGKRRPGADRRRVVKEYCRPAAGKRDPSPAELRPAHVLLTTTDYLIKDVTSISDRPWWQLYEYVFDRLRAVRQDMVIQRLSGPTATEVLEKIVRFHAYAGFRLCDEDLSHFDAHINDSHIQECLKRLMVVYHNMPGCRKHMAEFVGIYLLHNLANVDALSYALEHKQMLSGSPEFDLAMSISLAAINNNFVRVMKLAKCLNPLQLCALHRRWAQQHRHALLVMNSGFSSKNLTYSLGDLAVLLNMVDESEATSICGMYGLMVRDAGITFLRGTFKDPDKAWNGKSRYVEQIVTRESIPELLLGSKPS